VVEMKWKKCPAAAKPLFGYRLRRGQDRLPIKTKS